jgi:hypothetical protein
MIMSGTNEEISDFLETELFVTLLLMQKFFLI